MTAIRLLKQSGRSATTVAMIHSRVSTSPKHDYPSVDYLSMGWALVVKDKRDEGWLRLLFVVVPKHEWTLVLELRITVSNIR